MTELEGPEYDTDKPREYIDHVVVLKLRLSTSTFHSVDPTEWDWHRLLLLDYDETVTTTDITNQGTLPR